MQPGSTKMTLRVTGSPEKNSVKVMVPLRWAEVNVATVPSFRVTWTESPTWATVP